MAERLQKIIAEAGIASRRKAEKMITAGRVKVDGKVITKLGTNYIYEPWCLAGSFLGCSCQG